MNKQKKPNIVVIMTDQQQAAMMSCAGNRYVNTPAMDYIAEQGVRYTNAYSGNPVCLPSRFNIFTGLFPGAVGFRSNAYRSEMTQEMPSFITENGLGHVLKANGYNAVYGGKEHLPFMNAEMLGFDYICKDERYELADTMAGYVTNYSDEKPFCMVASFINPHDICLMALRDFADNEGDCRLVDICRTEIQEVDKALAEAKKYPQDVFFDEICPPLPDNYQPAEDEPEAIKFIQEQRGFKKKARENYTDEQWRLHRWAYAQLTNQVDTQIAVLIDALKEKGIMDDTVIIFTSDHGDFDSAHKMEHKTALYVEATQIPLVVKGVNPDRQRGTTCNELMHNGLDLIPTVLDYAGITPPEYLAKGHPRRSWRASAESLNSDICHRDKVLVESEFGKMIAGVAERVDQNGTTIHFEYNYVLYFDGDNREQFFDLSNNRGQMFNQLNCPEYEKIVAECREAAKTMFVPNQI